MIFFTLIQCVFIDFRFHRHVTSGDVIIPPFPCEGSGNTLGGSCLRSRFYSTPCFFESMATQARGLGRSLRFTHAQTNSMHVCVFLWMCVCSLPHARNPTRWLVEMGHVNTSDDVPMLMSHVTLKNNTPIVFLALYYLQQPTSWADTRFEKAKDSLWHCLNRTVE